MERCEDLQIKNISSPAAYHFIWKISPHGKIEGMNDVVDCGSSTRTQIPRTDAGLFGLQVLHCCEMAGCQIQNMDVIADGGTVLGCVV
jgi:hypothetical protein